MSVLLSRDHLVTYADTDAAAIVYFASWFPWAERLHSEWLLSVGHRIDEIPERHGVFSACRAASCEYFRPVRLFDRVRFDLRVGDVGRSSYTLELDVVAEDEVVVARVTMTLAFFTDAGPQPIPAVLREVIATHRC